MDYITKDLQPFEVFRYFEELCQIPHGSGNVKEISDYCVQFAKLHQLKYRQDESYNVIIWKPASMRTSRPSFCRDIWIWWLLRQQIVIRI